jgi:hypothetical protein
MDFINAVLHDALERLTGFYYSIRKWFSRSAPPKEPRG